MYSGTGTVTFDWIRYSKHRFSYSFLMDSEHRSNVQAARDFCRLHQIPFYLSCPKHMTGCPDSGISAVAHHLATHSYDFVECISWANASTNLAVMESVPDTTHLLFTPHSQPIWTIGDAGRFFMISEVFQRCLHAAQAIFIISRREMDLPEFAGVDSSRVVHTPNGVDTSRFFVAGSRTPNSITCVCDCREPRKRLDLLLAAFEIASAQCSALQLTLAGKGSDTLRLPESCKHRITTLGYIPDSDLTRLYQKSSLLTLLSDYEAFGLPIAEALCCGTQVLLNRQDVLLELFQDLPGVNWTHNTDTHTTAQLMIRLAATPAEPTGIAQACAARYAWDQTYGRKMQALSELMPPPPLHSPTVHDDLTLHP